MSRALQTLEVQDFSSMDVCIRAPCINIYYNLGDFMVVREGAKNTPRGGAKFWGETSLSKILGGVDQIGKFWGVEMEDPKNGGDGDG